MSTLHRIEQLVSAFESRSLLLRIRAQAIADQWPGRKAIYDTDGPVTHAHSLREHINAIGSDIDKLDVERYLPIREGQLNAYGMFGNIPVEVATWSALSRHVYAPTVDAQTILSASKLDEVTWADVQWPYGSFAIDLAEPIADPHGNVYDTMLVFRERPLHAKKTVDEGQEERTERLFEKHWKRFQGEVEMVRERIGQDLVLIRLLGPSLEQAVFTKKERELAYDLKKRALTARVTSQRTPQDARLKRAEEKAWHRFWRHLKQIERRMIAVTTPFFPISIERHGDLPVTKSVDDLRKTLLGACTCGKPNCFRNTDHPELDVAAQLVVGLCLYLQTATRPDRPLIGAWEPLPLHGRIVRNAITTGAVRCEVRAARTFTEDERDRILGRGNYTQGKWAAITWTAAYNRRPKGQGHDPNAPRSVRIESYPALRWLSKDPDSQEERSSAPISLI